MRKEGIKRAKMFDWNKTAEKIFWGYYDK